jgi:hypothetical protein
MSNTLGKRRDWAQNGMKGWQHSKKDFDRSKVSGIATHLRNQEMTHGNRYEKAKWMKYIVPVKTLRGYRIFVALFIVLIYLILTAWYAFTIKSVMAVARFFIVVAIICGIVACIHWFIIGPWHVKNGRLTA